MTNLPGEVTEWGWGRLLSLSTYVGVHPGCLEDQSRQRREPEEGRNSLCVCPLPGCRAEGPPGAGHGKPLRPPSVQGAVCLLPGCRAKGSLVPGMASHCDPPSVQSAVDHSHRFMCWHGTAGQRMLLEATECVSVNV